MGRHVFHAVMCLPMVLAAIVLVVLGATALAILLALVCALMMTGLTVIAVRDDRSSGRR